MNNYRYTVSDVAGEVAISEPMDKDVLEIRDLNPNELYYVRVYADVDLNDGLGLRKNYLLGELEITTIPISSLGFVNLKVETKNVKSNEFTLMTQINKSKTNKILVNVIDAIILNVIDAETTDVVYTETITGENLEKMKNLLYYEIKVEDLDSNNKYLIEYQSRASQGKKEFIFDCITNLGEIKTRKKTAQALITSKFVTQNMIDFDCIISDPDDAIILNEAIIELRNYKNDILESIIVPTNMSEAKRITFEGLNAKQTYYIYFYATEYNETDLNSEYQTKYEILKLEEYTEEGIFGKIELVSSLRKAKGINILDINSENKWIQNFHWYNYPKFVDSNSHMHIYSKNGAASYAYDLNDYVGELVTVTFKIKAVTPLHKNYKIYFNNYISGTTSSSYGTELTNIPTDSWKSYTFTYVVGSYNQPSVPRFYPVTGYTYGKNQGCTAGFYLSGGNGTLAEYEVSDMQVVVHEKETYLEHIPIESGTYSNAGAKQNSNTQTRTVNAIELKGGYYYQFNFTSKYGAIRLYDPKTNAQRRIEGYELSGKTYYFEKDTLVRVSFRRDVATETMSPDEVDFSIIKIEPTNNAKYEDFKYNLETQIKVNLTDLRNEITNDDYYIRIYEGNKLYKEYNYVELTDKHKIESVIKKVELEEHKDYRIELGVKIRERYYKLSDFEMNTSMESVGINNTNDWFYIQPRGNYIVLNDLDFRLFREQRVGFGYRYFYGTIDFQGYTMSTYTNYTESVRRFDRIEKSAVLKNLVLDVHYDNKEVRNYWTPFVMYNYGTISNIQINIINEQPSNFTNSGFVPLTYANQLSGVIENFTVNVVNPTNLYQNSTLLVAYNYGLIRNGYTYGEDLLADPPYSSTNPNIGLIQMQGGPRSTLENVYTLNSIIFASNSQIGAGLISRYTAGKVRNAYCVGSSNANVLSKGPAVADVGTTATLEKIYYLSNHLYTNKYHQRINETALNDISFQKSVFKDNFNIDALVKLGYYPHVIYTSNKMPSQPFIPLPEIPEDNLVDIISMNVLEQTNNEATVEFNVNNKQGEEITDIQISNLEVQILEQLYDEGKSLVKARLYKPTQYVSKYSIRKIESKNYLGYKNERSYLDGEKYAEVEFYLEINSVADWVKINKGLGQNYSIETDLDFNYSANYTINNFSGKIEGNNHTLKNINLEKAGLTGLINQMNGILQNLYIENFTLVGTSSYAGLVGYSNSNGRYYNVHLKNVNISANKTKTSDYFYAGALVGHGSNARIQECSATDVKIYTDVKINYVSLGGLVGYSDNIQITNSFAQNIDITSKNSISSYGVGGLIGKISGSDAYAANNYATGKIYNDNKYTGGLVGVTPAYIEKNFSAVNITSKINYTGGIVGYSEAGESDCLSRMTYNLYLGNIYADKVTKKIIGNYNAASNNASFEISRINGLKDNTAYGETVLTHEQLLDPETYRTIMTYENIFNYDKVAEGYLPKLYYENTEELMPNQVDTLLVQPEKFDILDLIIDQHAEYASVTTYLENPDGSEVTDVIVDGAEVEIVKNSYDSSRNTTIIQMKIYPEKYYDSYKLTKIVYKEEDQEKEFEKTLKLNIKFFKTIKTIDDWNSIDSTTPENYKLEANLDFTGVAKNNTNIIVNRLETVRDDVWYTIKGININIKSNVNGRGVIEKVNTRLANIIFEDITINDTTTSANNYRNIINYSNGTIENIKFKNITINTPYEHYASMIGYHCGPKIQNIELDGITVKGYNYAAGLLSSGKNDEGNIYSTVTAQKLNIESRGSYVGGIFGNLSTHHSYGNLVNNINIVKSSEDIVGTESIVKAPSGTYVGGIAGLGECYDCSVDGINVYGNVHVGGAFGQQRAYYSRRITVKNSVIEGDSYYIGGIAGYIRYVYDSYVENTEVRSNKSKTYGVGGIAGNQAAWEIRGCGLTNVNVHGKGTEHGGIVGRKDGGNVYSTYIQDSSVSGPKFVGGAVGSFRGGWVLLSNVTRTNITAETAYAGGLAGYMHNGAASNPAFRENLITAVNVKSKAYAAGLVGGLSYPIYTHSNIYSLYFEGNVVSDDTNVGLGTADKERHNNQIVSSYKSAFYENSKFNNEKLKDFTSTSLGSDMLSSVNITRGAYLDAGKPVVNGNYPYAAYTDFIQLTAGTTYVLDLDYNSGNDWVRIMIYEDRFDSKTETYNYVRTLTEGHNSNLITMSQQNAVTPKYVFTATKDCKIKISFYNIYQLNSYTLRPVRFGKSQARESQLLTYNDLRNKMTWMRYPISTSIDYYYYSPLLFNYSYFDFEPLNYKLPTITLEDKSGNKIPAELKATAITKDGVMFDGRSDIMTIDPSFVVPKELTVSATITDYSNSDPAYQFYFSNEDESKSSNGFGLFLHYRTLYIRINKGNYSTGITIPRYVPVDITVAYKDNKTAYIYINGELIKTLSIYRTINSIEGVSTKISPVFSSSYRFDGTIGELKVFNRALTDQEIKNNYQARSITSTDGLILYYDFKELENTSENGYYPTLYDYGIDVVPKNQIKTPLPVESEEQLITNSDSSSIKLVEDKISNIYDIYSSGTNTVNIEFDNIYDDVTFSYKNGSYISDNIKLTQKTYSLSYDYENDLELIINTRSSKKTITYTKEELKRTISIVNDKYYHIENNDLYENDKVIQKDIKHLYKNYALTKDNKLYNISTKEITESYNKQGVLETTTPLYSSIVNDQYINTYYNYSEILSDKQLVEREGQVLYKDNQLYLFKKNSNTKQDMNVFNNYNESTYQISLTKQRIVSLQNNIKVPSNFNNDKIIEISQDIDDNKPVIIIRYENGYVYVLDYNEGKELFTYGEEQQVTLFKYIFGNFSKDANLSSNKTYKSSKNLIKNIEKLNDQEIKEQLNNSNNNNQQEETETTDEEIVIEVENTEVINGKENKVSNGYIQVYNYDTGEYEVYSTDDILNTKEEKIESENTTINNNPFLYNYFYGNKLFELTTTKIIIYISIFILIVINLGLLVRFISNKEVRDHE